MAKNPNVAVYHRKIKKKKPTENTRRRKDANLGTPKAKEEMKRVAERLETTTNTIPQELLDKVKRGGIHYVKPKENGFYRFVEEEGVIYRVWPETGKIISFDAKTGRRKNYSVKAEKGKK